MGGLIMKETDLMKEIERLQAENDRLKCQVQELNTNLERTTNGIWEMVSPEEFMDRAINDNEFTGCRIDLDCCECVDAYDLDLHSFRGHSDSVIYIANKKDGKQ